MMYKKIYKRLFDVLLSSIALSILLIPFTILGILIKLDSKGPVFFIQERLGQFQKPFKVIKFRTMTNKKRKVTNQVFNDNPEITRLGKYLRRYKIDELPQVINVLIGQMSIVGPRPCVPSVIEKYNLSAKYRFLEKPGLTSIAGVNGSIYLSWEDKWKYDKYYIENISFYLDLKIILKTFLVILFGEERFLKEPKL